MKKILYNPNFLAISFMTYNYMCYNIGYNYEKYKDYIQGKITNGS